MREWLVIENSRAYGVFAPDNMKKIMGYIPRDVVEPLLGRNMEGTIWFTKDEGELMRKHPMWRDEEPD